MKEKLIEFNPKIDKKTIEKAIEQLTKDRSSLSLLKANQEISQLLKSGIKIESLNDNGEERTEVVKVIDWKSATNNHFLVASQMWISGDLHPRRPDLILFVNGLPMVLFELKKFTVNIKHAYDDNLSDYLDTIPHLFLYNAFVILSNGSESRIGAFTSPWEHFSEWKRITENENGKVSLETIIIGTCEKNRLIDILENFIIFSEAQGKITKIVARNHQYLGVNRAVDSYIRAKKIKNGKIGVFWHTTGSGKSYSMIFFSNKIFRKLRGNYTFLIVTDRIDLDNQIYKNFKKTGAVTEPEKQVRAKSAKHLKKLLKEDHRHVFSLIFKFKTEKKEVIKSGKKVEIREDFPVLSTREDIIIICDEAHRTQYGELASNMRTALPNAQFIAFTATPLFSDDEKTRQIFGEYVSTYNFKQSVEDNATVPLYYINRKPEVEVINNHLNSQIENLIMASDLDEDQIEKLRRKYPKEFQVLENPTRLDLISKDIVDHFMGRGYKGKAMVISIDRFTAVKMYNNVQLFWKRRIHTLEECLQKANEIEKDRLEQEIKFMKETDMAVIVSNSQNEVKKFKKEGLDIIPHRKRIVTEELDYKFKDAEDPLRIVFVCAMWMTGFDAPPVSTIYLDKPIRDHTLMQAISRANRVFGDKHSGMIVDYYGILRKLNRALKIYGSGTGGGINKGDIPLRNVDELVKLVKQNINSMEKFLSGKGISSEKILLASNECNFEDLRLIEEAKEAILVSDESKVLFLSLIRMVVNSYTDLLPDPRANEFRNLVSLYVHIGESIASDIPEFDMSEIEGKIKDLIIRSVAVKPELPKGSPVLDLSKLDLSKIQIDYKKGMKRTEAEKLRSILNRKLAELLRENKYRIEFQEKLERIVDEYNSGASNIEKYFKELTQLLESLQEEDKRHIKEGLTKEELAIFDILTRPNLKLSKTKEQQIKTVVKELLEKLKEQKFVLDWKKRTRTRADVQVTIENMLWDELPEPPYSQDLKNEKSNLVFQHVYDSYFGSGRSIYQNNP